MDMFPILVSFKRSNSYRDRKLTEDNSFTSNGLMGKRNDKN